MSTAKEWKDKGNLLVQEQKFAEALECYSKAIELDSNDPILYSNRSLMHSNLNEFESALIDADKAIEINPNYSKAYLRRGKALEGLGRNEEALNTYHSGLEKDNNNVQLMDAIKKLEKIQSSTVNINKDIKTDKSKNIIEKYALKKYVKIFFDKPIDDRTAMTGVLEEIGDGFLLLDDDIEGLQQLINVNNIIDIKILKIEN